MLGFLLVAGIAGVVSLFGFVRARRYVRERLRFVDAVQRPAAPLVAGGLAALLAGPVVWLLPWVGAGTALAFGIAVGAGVSAGARDARALPGV